MNQNIGLDIPAGKIARLQFNPVTEDGKVAKLDGPLEVTLVDDTSEGRFAVGGQGGLIVDLDLPDTEGAVASFEIDGDADLDPANREVLTTIVNCRRLGEVPGKAVTLGASPESAQFVGKELFGQFPDATAQGATRAEPRRR